MHAHTRTQTREIVKAWSTPDQTRKKSSQLPPTPPQTWAALCRNGQATKLGPIWARFCLDSAQIGADSFIWQLWATVAMAGKLGAIGKSRPISSQWGADFDQSLGMGSTTCLICVPLNLGDLGQVWANLPKLAPNGLSCGDGDRVSSEYRDPVGRRNRRVVGPCWAHVAQMRALSETHLRLT